MAQYGKFNKTVLDSHGNPISGASVEIRTQGAFVTSTQAGPVYTVNDPGGIVAATSTCVVNLTTAPSRACTAATASTVTFGVLGFGELVDNDRITVSSPLPTLYADAQGAATKSNPLTTDANGYCFCWLPVVPVDIKTSASGYSTRLETDVLPEGSEFLQSNIFSATGIKAFRKTTNRTLSDGYIETWENPVGTVKASIARDGTLDLAGNATIAGTMAVTGNVALTGDLTVDDITMDDLTVDTITAGGLITANAGITSAAPFTYSGATGSFSLTAGSIETADLATNAVVKTYQGVGSADQTFTAAAYNTANYVDITNATTGLITPSSASSEIVVTAYCPHEASGAAAYFGWMAIKDDSGNILVEGGSSVLASQPDCGPTLVYRTTGSAAARTYKVSAQCETANMKTQNSTRAATGRVTRIVAMEFKK